MNENNLKMMSGSSIQNVNDGVGGDQVNPNQPQSPVGVDVDNQNSSNVGGVSDWRKSDEGGDETDNSGGGGIGGWIKGVVVAVMILILMMLVVGAGGGVLAATGVVEVPDEAKKAFLNVWVRLPLVPKPPEYILAQAMISMESVEELDLDFSLAFKSASLEQMLGSSDFDLVITGPVNFEDTGNPEMALNFKTNNQIDVDVVRKGDLYFRVNQIPQVILGMMMGLSEEDAEDVKQLLGRWVHYQKNEVDSAARSSLEEQAVVSDSLEKMSQKMQVLLDEKIKPLMEVEDVSIDGMKATKISVELEGQVINDLVSVLSSESKSMETKKVVDSDEILPSDVLKKVNMSLWVDSGDFYVRKVEMYMLVDNGELVERWGDDGIVLGMPMERETIEMVLAVEMDKFGEASVVEVPSQFDELEDYTAELMEVVMGINSKEMEKLEHEEMSQEDLERMMQEQQYVQTENSSWGAKVLGIWTEEELN